MKFVNLTPHAVNIIDGPTIPPEGKAARLSVTCEELGEIDGIRLVSTVYGEVENLPEEKEGVVLIVSSLVADRYPDRYDLAVPTDFVRNEEGGIVGCRALSLN